MKHFVFGLINEAHTTISFSQVPVDIITDNREPKGCSMHPELMSPTGVRLQSDTSNWQVIPDVFERLYSHVGETWFRSLIYELLKPRRHWACLLVKPSQLSGHGNPHERWIPMISLDTDVDLDFARSPCPVADKQSFVALLNSPEAEGFVQS